jgi:predicted metal-binding membrane protein
MIPCQTDPNAEVAVAKAATFDTARLRPKLLLTLAILLLSALAWLQLFGGGSAVTWNILNAVPTETHAHVHVHGDPFEAWSLRDVGVSFLMWLLMAVAMMLPTAIPAILGFADMAKATARSAGAAGRVGSFVAGYLLAWWGFGVAATGMQWVLAGALRGSMTFRAEYWVFAGMLVVASGAYQFSALKDLCLTQCRNPVMFFLANWRDGLRGAMSLGLRHGLYCIGCCWALMALMLLAGTMSLGWMAALGVVMLLEKVTPGKRIVSGTVGVALIVGGAVLIGMALTQT